MSLKKEAATRLDKVFKAATKNKKRDLLVHMAIGTKQPTVYSGNFENIGSVLKDMYKKKGSTYKETYKTLRNHKNTRRTNTLDLHQRLNKIKEYRDRKNAWAKKNPGTKLISFKEARNSIDNTKVKDNRLTRDSAKFNPGGFVEDINPNKDYYIRHHGGKNVIARAKAGGKAMESTFTRKSGGDFKQDYGVEVTVNPDRHAKPFTHSMKRFAEKSRRIGDTPSVMTGVISGKHLKLHQGSPNKNIQDNMAYIPEINMKYIRDYKVVNDKF